MITIDPLESPKRGPSLISPHIKKELSDKYFKYSDRNRDCKDLDFTKCSNYRLYNPVILGNGAFGIIIKFNHNIAVKFIFNISYKPSADKFIDMDKEISFSYHMGNIGVGPAVLDTFHYSFNLGELIHYPELFRIIIMIKNHFSKMKRVYPQFEPVKEYLDKGIQPDVLPIEIQCIVMKAYDNDCKTILEVPIPDITAKVKTEIVRQMIDLIKKQIDNGLYCSDIKPTNYVMNIDLRDNVEVKMIDFGTDFCTEKNIYVGYKNTDDISKLTSSPNDKYGINFIELLYISNIIQLYAIIINLNIFEDFKNEKDMQMFIGAFFKHEVFVRFFGTKRAGPVRPWDKRERWEIFIGWYIEHAKRNVKNKVSDPSNSLMWYSTPDKKDIYSDTNVARVKNFLIGNLQVFVDYNKSFINGN